MVNRAAIGCPVIVKAGVDNNRGAGVIQSAAVYRAAAGHRAVLDRQHTGIVDRAAVVVGRADATNSGYRQVVQEDMRTGCDIEHKGLVAINSDVDSGGTGAFDRDILCQVQRSAPQADVTAAVSRRYKGDQIARIGRRYRFTQGAFQIRGDYTNLTPLTPLSKLERGERTAGSAPISPRQVPDVSNRREGFRIRAYHCPIGAPSPTAVTVGEGGAGVTLGVRVG